MSVSVVIPLFEGEPYIRQALESVFAQASKPEQIIVVDDGCTDGSLDIVSQFPGITLLRNTGKGTAPARRFGALHATSDYVAMFDQDDHWHPQHLSLLEEILAGNPDCPAAIASTCRFHTRDQLKYSKPEIDCRPLDPWALFPTNVTSTPSAVLIRRSRLEAIGGWPTDFTGVVDYYTWLRLATDNNLIENRPVSVGRRVHRTSYSWRLRQGDYTGQVRNMVSAARDALDRRTKTPPEDIGRLHTRLEALQLVPEIISSALGPDPARLCELMTTFAQKLSGETAHFDQRMRNVINWYIQPYKWIETDSVSGGTDWKRLLVDCLHDPTMRSGEIARRISTTLNSL